MKTLKQKYEDSKKNSLNAKYELKEKLRLIESKTLINEVLDDATVKKITDILSRLRAISDAFQNQYLNSVVNFINKKLINIQKSSKTGKWLKNKLGLADNLKKALAAIDALENGFSQLPILVKNSLQIDLAEMTSLDVKSEPPSKTISDPTEKAKIQPSKSTGGPANDPTLLMISNAAQEKKEIKTKDFKSMIAKAFQPSKDWRSVYKLNSALQRSFFDASELASQILKTKVSILSKTTAIATKAKSQTKSEDAEVAQALAKEAPANQQKTGSEQKPADVDQLAKTMNLNAADKDKVQKWYNFFKEKGLTK